MNTAPNPNTGLSRPIKAACLLLSWALINSAAHAAEAPEVVAVSSRVSQDYVRTKLADGTFAPETYVFGEGGKWNRSMADASLEKLQYKHVAFTVSKPLAAQNYFRAQDPDPNKNKLLIMVYWGMTHGTDGASGSVAYQNVQEAMRPAPEDNIRGSDGEKESGSKRGFAGTGGKSIDPGLLMMISMVNRQRDRIDRTNASILGYDQELERSIGLEIGPMRTYQMDLLQEIEENRYFVVLMAYDFRLLWKEKKPKLLWVTRFSISERGNLFDEQLDAMAQAASRYFGQDSNGLRRKPITKGRVDLGELKVIGVVPEK